MFSCYCSIWIFGQESSVYWHVIHKLPAVRMLIFLIIFSNPWIAAPSASNGTAPAPAVEMDLLGSLSESFSSNSLALVTTGQCDMETETNNSASFNSGSNAANNDQVLNICIDRWLVLFSKVLIIDIPLTGYLVNCDLFPFKVGTLPPLPQQNIMEKEDYIRR